MPKAGDVVNQYRINDYLSLKLEWVEIFEGKPELKTVVYVGGERFRTCMHLLFQLPAEVVQSDEIKSIDDLRLRQIEENSSKIRRPKNFTIPPETEFFGHCSNLQAWADYDYNTRLLDRMLALPLLKRLYEVGDPVARRYAGEDLIARLKQGRPQVQREILQKCADLIPREELLRTLLDDEGEIHFFQDLERINSNHRFIFSIGRRSAANIYVIDKHIEVITIRGSKVSRIPPSIQNLKHLTSISLFDASIAELPEEINNLPNLERLTIKGGNLSAFPEFKRIIMNGKLRFVDLTKSGLDPDNFLSEWMLSNLLLDERIKYGNQVIFRFYTKDARRKKVSIYI